MDLHRLELQHYQNVKLKLSILLYLDPDWPFSNFISINIVYGRELNICKKTITRRVKVSEKFYVIPM